MKPFRATKVTADGHTFDSKREYARYCELKLRLRAGEIRNLELHPVYPLVVNGIKVGRYTADFRYEERVGARGIGGQGWAATLWCSVVEDVKSKGSRTQDYLLRKRIVEALHGVRIVEIDPDKRRMR